MRTRRRIWTIAALIAGTLWFAHWVAPDDPPPPPPMCQVFYPDGSFNWVEC